jgi:predicted Zn finger-like uncharacterized protein
VLIRCDKCTTLYELDDKLLPRQGARVQCSRCQFVFTAYPPADGVAGSQGPANPPLLSVAGGEPLATEQRPEPAPRASGADGAPSKSSSAGESVPTPRRDTRKTGPAASSPELPPDAKFTADGRPIRKVSFPTEEAPRTGPPRVNPRASVPVKSSRPRRNWLLPMVVVVVAVLLAGAAYWFLRHRSPRAWHRRSAEVTHRTRSAMVSPPVPPSDRLGPLT